MKLQRIIASSASVIALLAGSLLFSAPADAASYSSTIWSPSGIAKYRSCPSATRCDGGFYVRNGDKVQMLCWIDSDWATGAYSSNRWFKVVAQGALGRTGYIHSSLVYNQTRVGKCSN